MLHSDAVWTELVPDSPVNRRFLDEDFQTMYLDENRQAQILTSFSMLAIFVACLGLFGVSLFSTERRTKEIGIRKTLGGSSRDIVWLLTSEFSKLVLVANLIAWPVAYIVMNAWLSNFAYRIEMGPLLFFGSGLVAFVIAWTTVGGVAARAAGIRPAAALRYE